MEPAIAALLRSRPWRWAVVGLLGPAWLNPAGAGAERPPAPAAAATAFVGASVVPMDRERVLGNQTVVVENGRIAALGPAGSVRIPGGAAVIDARGRYLLPGLADMHVHLGRDVGARPDFGDGPIFLASGITTVLNLHGDADHLRWRRQIEDGEILAPTLYTAGEFVNEPRINTPADAEREVRAQQAAGFDVIKFREVVVKREVVTTHGLSLDTYRRLIAAARAAGIPLVGHAPNNLGIEAALDAGQSLAHAGAFLFGYFWPNETRAFRTATRLSIAGAALVLLVIVLAAGGAAARRERAAAAATPVLRKALSTDAILAFVAAAAGALSAREIHGLRWLDDDLRRAVLFVVGAAIVGILATLAWRAGRRGRARRLTATAGWRRFLAIHATVAVVALLIAAPLAAYWTSILWRSSSAGMDRIAVRARRAGIFVITTLVVNRWTDLADRASLGPIDPRLLRAWQQRARPMITGERRRLGTQELHLIGMLVGKLHRAGVPIVAGTDTLGWPFITPGLSLHEELACLAGAGMSRFAVLRAATAEPANLLGRGGEFGTIAVGGRADLVLTDRNPLEDLNTLRTPRGVMTRGRWLSRETLQAGLDALAGGPLPSPNRRQRG